MITPNLKQSFDKVAAGYDQQAALQAYVADRLVAGATFAQTPITVLDLGCGTGLVAEAIKKKWPQTHITALDHASAMLQQAQQKLPDLEFIIGDAVKTDFNRPFDAIFSSMMLHWLPDPRAALKRWKTWLKPGGYLYIALLVEGSFHEWHDLCQKEGIKDGLWAMPSADFAVGLSTYARLEKIALVYPTARCFLQRLKSTGAATPHSNHKPLSTSAMRHLLAQASQPFSITYHTLYLQIPSPSI